MQTAPPVSTQSPWGVSKPCLLCVAQEQINIWNNIIREEKKYYNLSSTKSPTGTDYLINIGSAPGWWDGHIGQGDGQRNVEFAPLPSCMPQQRRQELKGCSWTWLLHIFHMGNTQVYSQQEEIWHPVSQGWCRNVLAKACVKLALRKLPKTHPWRNQLRTHPVFNIFVHVTCSSLLVPISLLCTSWGLPCPCLKPSQGKRPDNFTVLCKTITVLEKGKSQWQRN